MKSRNAIRTEIIGVLSRVIIELTNLVGAFCQRHELKLIPKVKDRYDFHIGSTHTKLFESGHNVIFLSELAVGVSDDQIGKDLIRQFIIRSAQYINTIPDAVVLDDKNNTLYLQRSVALSSLDEIIFEDTLFEHMDNSSLYTDIC